MRRSFLCNVFFILVVLLSISATSALESRVVSEPSSASDSYTVHVTASSLSMAEDCGTLAEPCSLQGAILHAPPYATLTLEPGVYSCGFRIVKPLYFVASGAGVVMDCKHHQRALWFDNVPARIDGITFRNGYGEAAGCVLITMNSNHPAELNNITRSRFVNCTGYGRPGYWHDVVGGALAIIYDVTSGRSIEVVHSNFSFNHARSSALAAGAMTLSYGPVLHPPKPSQQPSRSCDRFLLTMSSELAVSPYSGLFFKVPQLLHEGLPVYANVTAFPVATETAWVSYCAATQSWGFAITNGVVDTNNVTLAPCFAEVYSAPTVGLPDDALWYVNGKMVFDGPRFTCEDHLHECTVLQLSNVPPSQSARAGVFEKTVFVKAMRPVFRRREDPSDNKSQFAWYCEQTQEWIITDDDPNRVANNTCNRGIASVPSLTGHPLGVQQWRYWDGFTWRLSSTRAGLFLRCAPPPNDDRICKTIQLINSPTSDIPSTVFILRQRRFRDRPVYSSRGRSVWYCGTFNEWVVSHLEAPQDPSNEVCDRPISSSTTSNLTPVSYIPWSYLENDTWAPHSPTPALRCVDNCSSITLDAEEPTLRGIYEVVRHGVDPAQKIFLRTVPPLACIALNGDGFWEIRPSEQSGEVVYRQDPATTRVVHPFQVNGWQKYQASADTWTMVKAQPVLLCNLHRRCRVLNVSASSSTYATVTGTYTLQSRLIASRPSYALTAPTATEGTTSDDGTAAANENTPLLYYCAKSQVWVFGFASKVVTCTGFASSTPTTTYWPHDAQGWVIVGVNKRSSTSQLRVRCMNEPVEGDASAPVAVSGKRPQFSASGLMSAARAKPNLELSDCIQSCQFHNNFALGYDSSISAGGVVMYMGESVIGDDHMVSLRRVQMTQNTAVGMQRSDASSIAGAIVLHAVSPQRHLHTLTDVLLRENVGPVGGVLFHRIQASAVRLAMKSNSALESGAGMHVSSLSNVTCANCVCQGNNAAMHGGCAYLSTVATLSLTKCDVIDNLALGGEGAALNGGSISLSDCKIAGSQDSAMQVSSSSLFVANSQVTCGQGSYVAHYTAGIGCLPNIGFVSKPSGVTHSFRAVAQSLFSLPISMVDWLVRLFLVMLALTIVLHVFMSIKARRELKSEFLASQLPASGAPAAAPQPYSRRGALRR